MRTSVLACALVASAGCGGDPETLGWEMVMEDPVLTDRVAAVTATIRRDGCGGALVYTAELSRTGASPTEPPVLEDGTWAFSGRATDASCRLIAEGCFVADLPTPGPVRVVLGTIALPTPLCDTSVCSMGRCLGSGEDAGPRDAAMGDGGFDAGPGEPCGTGRCTDCTACEMDTCVPRSDGFVCAGGAGRCVAAECCMGCVDLAGACQPGDARGACGAAGESCVPCGACEFCVGNACVAPDGGCGTDSGI